MSGLTSAERQLLRRFSYGFEPRLLADVRRAGGAHAWFDQQTHPSQIADPEADALESWWPHLRVSPAKSWRLAETEELPGWVQAANYQRWLIARRMVSRRQLVEVMTEFWEGHLHVPVEADGVFTWRAHYGSQLRSRALGSYVDLLRTAITHPAMGIYLGNAVSTKKDTNENLGRELLELHTVGRGNFTESDVKASARILTGYRVDLWNTWAADYDPKAHATGHVRVLGFSSANRDRDGRKVCERYLRYLALHPLTATRIATKVATAFVSDSPSEALVRRLAALYLKHDSEILPMLRALTQHPEFLASAGAKVRTPTQDVIASYRALGIRLRRPAQDEDAANAVLWSCASLGDAPFAWARPDGPPLTSQPWATTSRLLASFNVHLDLSGGWWPNTGLTAPPAASWLPKRRTRFADLVDHLSRRLLGRRATAAMLTACCQATGLSGHDTITAESDLVRWGMPTLLATFLDSPDHMTR